MEIENFAILKAEIKSILAYKAKNGATFHDVKDEYAGLMGKKLCFDSEKQFNIFMREMTDAYANKGPDGHLLWFSNSAKSKHISNMVQNQKPPREVPVRQHSPLKRKVFHNSTGTCYYNDNYLYKNKRSYKSDSSLNEAKRAHKSSSFYNYDLAGDDFFLNITHLDCKQQLDPPSRSGFKGRPIKACGLCVSGQSIKAFTNAVKANGVGNDQIILNIGSVDLLHGRSFLDMQHDFIELHKEMENRGIHAVITTVAPLANMLHSKEVQQRWHQFNMFLLSEFSNVIDITCCFVSNTNRMQFECYQAMPKYVTGSSQAHLLWNFIGRQRVLKHLKDSLAELSYRNSIFDNDF